MTLNLSEVSNRGTCPYFSAPGLDERGAQLVHQHEDERARDNAAEPDDERAHPRPVNHAGGHLDYLARDEGHDDLKELDCQQNEEAPGAGVADVGGDAVDTAGLEQLVDHGPDEHDHHDHDDEERDEPYELEDVRRRHRMPGDRLLLVGLRLELLKPFGMVVVVRVLFHGFQSNAAAPRRGRLSGTLYLSDEIVSRRPAARRSGASAPKTSAPSARPQRAA